MKQSQKVALSSIIDGIAITNLLKFDENYTRIKWDKIPASRLTFVTNEKNTGKPVKLLARISELSDPFPMQLTPKRRETVHTLVLTDDENRTIECFAVAHSDFSEQLRLIRQNQTTLVFCGTILSVIQPFCCQYFFYLKSINGNITPLDRIYADTREIVKTKKLLQVLRKKDIRKYIKVTLVKKLGIKGIDEAKELNKALEFNILQSFSRGKSTDGRYSNKLHSLVIGSPAVGKKLLTRTALILNPVGNEISSTSGKVTPAGLIGNVKIGKGMTISNPGYLPLSSGGILCVQDFHEITKNKGGFSSILSKVMEDGEVIDSTSARTTHSAITSIHLDMNRLSQVNPDKEYNSFTDLNIPMNIISRFDSITEIPPDVSRQSKIAMEMAKGEKILDSNESQLAAPRWQRELKVLVAYITSKFTVAKIDARTSRYIQEQLRKMVEMNEKYATVQAHFSGMLTRIEISIEKICKAIACSARRTKVIKADVDQAFYFLSDKMEFLQTIDPLEIPDFNAQKVNGKENRMKMIQENYSGKEVRVSEVLEFLNSSNPEQVDLRTVQRYLSEMEGKSITRVQKGIWKVN